MVRGAVERYGVCSILLDVYTTFVGSCSLPLPQRLFIMTYPYHHNRRTEKFVLDEEFVESFKDKPAPFGFSGLGHLVYLRTYSRMQADGTKEEWYDIFLHSLSTLHLPHLPAARSHCVSAARSCSHSFPRYQTVARVVNGTYNMQKDWVEGNDLGWKPKKAQRSAKEMYQRIFDLKFSPPGRGLWAMGSPLTEKKQLFATLNNWYVKLDTTPLSLLFDRSLGGTVVRVMFFLVSYPL